MRNTKHITAGAFTVALTSLIIVLDRVTVGMMMSFLALPLIIYGYYYSFKSTMVVFFSCVLMSFVLTGYLPLIISTLGYGFIGLSLVYSRNRSLSNLKTYGLMYVCSIPVYAVLIVFFGEYFGLSLKENYDLMYSSILYLSKLEKESKKASITLDLKKIYIEESFIKNYENISIKNDSETESKKIHKLVDELVDLVNAHYKNISKEIVSQKKIETEKLKEEHKVTIDKALTSLKKGEAI